MALSETQWLNETMGEDTLAINQDVRNVYFGLKHIILKEIETSNTLIDTRMYFTGVEGLVNARGASDQLMPRIGRSQSGDKPESFLIKKRVSGTNEPVPKYTAVPQQDPQYQSLKQE